MRPDAPLLAFDTAAPHCAAAILRGGVVVAEETREMARGQAEALMPMLEALMARAGVAPRDLGGLAVGIGPGNFTGIRISVAAARGLALALGVPAAGVSAFEVLADTAGAEDGLLSLEGPRGTALVQPFAGGRATDPPRQIDPGAPPADLALPGGRVIGWRADEIAAARGAAGTAAAPEGVAARVARLGAARLAAGAPPPPAPLYVRPADADPPADPPPRILDDA